MSMKSEEAKALFSHNFNCAQSVAAVFSEKYGMDRNTVLKLCSGFGGGIRNGEICGAVSGAVMIIGLKYGQDDKDDLTAKNNCYKKTAEFTEAFRKDKNSLICKDLLGCDITTEEGRKTIRQNDLFNTKCARLIEYSVELMEALGY